jgi:Zn-dependent protease with chaperone function
MIRRMARLLGMALLAASLFAAAAGPARQAPPSPPPEDGGWREAAKERSRRALVLYVGGQAAAAVFLAWLAFSGAAARLRERVSDRLTRPWARTSAYVALVLGLLACASLPFDVSRYALSRAYGVGRQPLASWLGDYALALALDFAVAVPLGLAFYRLLDRRPRTWWRWVAAAATPLAVAAVAASPFYMALFNTFTPLGDRALAGRILDLAAREGIRAEEVYVVDLSRQTRAANAFVTGVGPTTIVALGDTLLENFRDEEVLFVMAHEMGHYVLRHLWQGILAGAALAVAGAFLLQSLCRLAVRRYYERLKIDDLADVASFPLVLLAAGLIVFAVTPVANAVSRHMEAEADRYALELTVPGDVTPEAAVSAFERLGRLGLSDPSPHPLVKALFWTHPPIDERIAAVRRWAAGEGRARAATDKRRAAVVKVSFAAAPPRPHHVIPERGHSRAGAPGHAHRW